MSLEVKFRFGFESSINPPNFSFNMKQDPEEIEIRDTLNTVRRSSALKQREFSTYFT